VAGDHRSRGYAAGVRFELEQQIPAPYDEVVATLLDESYQRSLTDLPPLKDRELIEQRSLDDGKVIRVTRCVLAIDSGGAIKRFIGDGDPAWIEEATWHPDVSEWVWRIIPEVAKELLSADGTIVLHENGDHTLRRVAGDVKVRVPLYGGKVEGWIVEGLEHTYEEEARRLLEWLERENA
jgi:hypothetical protein